MKILLIGGSGTWGNEAVSQLYPTAKKIIIYSRDEYKHHLMAEKWPEYPDNIMRYRIGDVRDVDRLTMAMEGCTHVILAAAMKRVDACAADPIEALKTMVTGAQNTIIACTKNKINKCLFLSTDKACNPATYYGYCKALAEQTIIYANGYGITKFSAVRYPNVEASRGSCLEIWDRLSKADLPIPITEPDATRMWIKKYNAVKFSLDRLNDMEGGEVFIPKCFTKKSLRALVEDRYPDSQIVRTGFRCVEKMHEELISETEARYATETESHVSIRIPNDAVRQGCAEGKSGISEEQSGLVQRFKSDGAES